MLGRILVIVAGLVFLLHPAVAPAGPLFPLQLGGYYAYDGSDGAGHTWNSKIKVVAQNISLNEQTYFHVRQQNLDPYDPTRTGPRDMLMRCTDTQAYISMGDTEALQFQTGPTGTEPWTTIGGDSASITADSLTVNVPFLPGTFFPVYENTFTSSEPGAQPWLAYLFPDLGLIKQVDHWVAAGRDPVVLALREAGVTPVLLFPLKTGLRLIYNASDYSSNTWQMHMQILEQVSLGGQTYFHGRQTNYDPIGGDYVRDFYLRSTDREVYVSDGVNERLEFQAASPGTAWDFPDPPGTIFKQIADIRPINVLGGSYLAYRHDSYYQEGEIPSPPMLDYMVPGLGIVKMEDYWIEPSERAPLTFTLVKIIEGDANAGARMLLLE
jgi:hypothetical protein